MGKKDENGFYLAINEKKISTPSKYELETIEQ